LNTTALNKKEAFDIKKEEKNCKDVFSGSIGFIMAP
jgi:hypothetical protein